MESKRLLTAWACVSLAGMASVQADPIAIDWVLVGDAGNAPDTRYASPGYGAVSHEYRIGKYEVTNGEYIAFLNAVAATDTYGLYNPNMASTHGGIAQYGSSGYYTYGPKDGDADWLDRPVNYVSWYDTLRFANWLHNGQPGGPQNAPTTEGGAYTFTGQYEVGDRNANARVWLTSEDEWYKAAYYKGGRTDAGYWNYATRSDLTPDNNWPDSDSGNSANYNHEWTPPYLTQVGAYSLSRSAYGTFDQNGNVFEWNEALVEPPCRGIRGGAWNHPAAYLPASNNDCHGHPIYDECSYVGFRVASIPEPTPALLLLAISVFVLSWRKSRRTVWPVP